MKVLFYAPMKPPDHERPSGDRRMARQFIACLKTLGHEVELASRLRTWRSTPKPGELDDIRDQSRTEVDQLSETKADLFITYRQYHKAPDLIGPAVSWHLGVPYVILEASHAEHRRQDDWQVHLEVAEAALLKAHAVVAMHNVDRRGLEAIIKPRRLHTLLPFLAEVPSAPSRKTSQHGPIRLVTVAMMRPGDKTRSFEILAKAWNQVPTAEFHLTIVGDGEARTEIEGLFPRENIHFAGFQTGPALAKILNTADAFVWPAWREAYGMAILEAMAAGLPVIVGDAGGIPDIVTDKETGFLVPVGDANAFANAITSLTKRRDRLADMGATARAHILRNHSVNRAEADLKRIIDAAFAEAGRAAPA
ncbi:MAG: glycosyltransferase family 4 protein [Pseudomonadota bacterium]